MARIILVGFEAEDVALLNRLLGSSGNQVTNVKDAPRASQNIRSGNFDVGLVNFRLSGLSGFQFIDGLSHHRISEIPLIILLDKRDETDAFDDLHIGEIESLFKHELTPHILDCAIRQACATQQIKYQLREATELLRTIIDLIPMMIYVRDEQGKILLANRAAADTFGIPLSKLVGAGMHDLHANREEAEHLLMQDRALMDSGETVHIDRKSFFMPGGRKISQSVTKIPFAFPGKTQKVILILGHDLTSEVEKQNLALRMQAAMESIGEAVLITDPSGKIEYINPAFEALTGYSEEEAIGNTPSIVKSGKHDEAFYKEMWDILLRGETFRGLLFNRRKDGTVYEAEETISPVRDLNNNIVAYIAVERDVTDKRMAAEALRLSDERYQLATKGANDGLWDWDITQDTLHVSPRMLSMIGRDPEQTEVRTPQDYFAFIYPDDREELKSRLMRHIKGLTEYFHHEYRIVDAAGNTRWMLARGLALRDQDGKAYRFAGSQTDITELKENQLRLKEQALRDALTGFPNREMMLQHIAEAIAKVGEQPDRQAYLFYMDIDRFKSITDSVGHVLGDRMLLKVARRIKECLHPEDIVSRLSGDEFAILVQRPMSIAESEVFALNMTEKLSSPFNLEGQQIRVVASFGIAVIDNTSSPRPEHILRDADVALRASKTSDSRVTIFNKTMHESAAYRLKVENDLDKAIERDEFRLYYQPIVNLKTERLAGFEALVRWQRGDEVISPDTFIPIAEATGQIIPIGNWVIEEAIRQLGIWQQMPGRNDIYVSLNISPLQLKDPNTIDVLTRHLEESGIDPSTVRIEITESAILDNAKRTLHQLNKFKTLGVLLYLDDFGTGYSSFSYLHSMPFDVIKIDRSFITDLCANKRKSMIVRSIIQMAHNLDLRLVAEGIEEREQMAMLQALECNFGQGYFFNKPLPSEDALSAWQPHE